MIGYSLKSSVCAVTLIYFSCGNSALFPLFHQDMEARMNDGDSVIDPLKFKNSFGCFLRDPVLFSICFSMMMIDNYMTAWQV